MMNEPEVVVALRGLERRFGDRKAVDGLDLELFAGECLGLLGPNGAGKSTTVRILSTLLPADGGEVRVLGQDPKHSPEALRDRIGVVPQDLAVYGHLTAAENLRFFGELQGLRGKALREAVERGLELAGLAERAGDRVEKFSGGMKRRLNVAVALLHDPELVFLDEPTVGIDPQSRNHVFETVERLHAEGVTMIYTSHQLGEVERLCDRIVILDRGRKIAEGTLRQLQESVLENGHGSSRSAGTLRFQDAGELARARALLEREGLNATVEEQLPDLESVFLAMTGHALRDGGEA